MKRTYSFAFIFLQILIFVTANGIYTIVSPGTIQPNTDFSVGVTLHENSEPVTINLAIAGPSYNETKTVNVSPSQMQIVNFKVPQIKSGLYMLNVNGVKGLTFENFTNLIYRDRVPNIYIQTDKAIYKPGDLVQYRIVVLDEEVRPVKSKQPLKMELRDGGGNFVKQLSDIQLNKGVYSGEVQLSEEPILGDWIIEVSMNHNGENIKNSKEFEVAKYVLPKYSFEIETASDVTYEDPIKVTIRAKYTYGKPVKGQATIRVETNYGKSKSEKVVDVNGKGRVEFNLGRDLDVYRPKQDDPYTFSYTPPIKVSAVMIEEFTGNKLEQTINLNLHNSRYLIEVTSSVYDYYANVPFEITAYVKTLDGAPVEDAINMAVLMIDKVHRDNTPDNPLEGQFLFSSELDKNGKAVFHVVLPTADNYHSVKVVYKDQFQQLNGLTGRNENDNKEQSLKLIRKTEDLQTGRDVIVEVQSNKDIPYYVYAIVARGNIVKQEHVKLPGNIKSHEIKFKPSFSMVPQSSLYVYYVVNGDLKFEEMNFDFPKEFENKVEITAPKEAKPSEAVTVKVKADPDSFVGLLGVDQSVLLLKTGNDLNYNKIMEDLDSFKTITPPVPGSGDYPGKKSGLVTLTNANFPYVQNYDDYYDNEFIYSSAPMYEDYTPATEIIEQTTLYSYILQVEQTPTVIRTVFNEIWIYQTLNNTDPNGIATFTKNIPDTITSWVVTGFSVNEKTGFGMVKNPTNVNVFQPFFATTSLPYSVKRGEIISIPIVLFNYMDKAIDAEVTMENTDGEYDFTEASNEIEEVVLTDKQRSKRVSVPSNSGEGVSFMIRPNKVGDITLKIKATSPVAGDAIHKKLKVEPEGITQFENHAIFVNPTASKLVNEILQADIPQDAVLDSEYLEFSVVGDILGPTIKNIDNLVHQPSGCGEQNMVNFVPNILVLHYLDAIKSNMPDVVKKAKNFMEIGYQRQLIYKHDDGSYSAFGEGKSQPNSWLTAYVARSFIQAKKYTTIDQAVLDSALKYVLSNQLGSGQFKQTGRLFHPSHQNDVGFTAFVLLTLLEDTDYSNKYKTEVDKALKYIADNVDKESDTYALAIALLAFKKAQHSNAAKVMEKLEKLAHDENGLKWWTPSSKDQMYNNNNIEITGYILQAYVYSEPVGKLLPIIKWLIGQRNNLGGFDSTQDTVVGLQALIKFAEKHISSGNGKVTIKFEAQDSQGKETTKGRFTVDKQNALIVQSHVLPKSSRKVSLEAEGEGSSLLYLSYRYNLDTKDNKPGFTIKHTILKTPQPSQLKMSVCAKYTPGADNNVGESNMAIMQIFLPSGFTADKDKFDNLRQDKKVQRVESKNEDTTIIIYIDYLTAGQDLCLEVNAERTHAVAKQKPAAIVVYDYYNSEQRATVYYEVKSSLCDICEGAECGRGCGRK